MCVRCSESVRDTADDYAGEAVKRCRSVGWTAFGLGRQGVRVRMTIAADGGQRSDSATRFNCD